MLKKILVPIDGSDLSNEAVNYASLFARRVGALVLFCIAEPESAPWMNFGLGAIFNPQTLKALHDSAKLEAEKILKQALNSAQSTGIAASTRLVFNDHPYEAIMEVAEQEGCDLIIMASHGRKGVSGLLLGSETQKVLTHSAIPVLVYRNAEAA
jgi:nucleotide-binding universal stress UspA family protein